MESSSVINEPCATEKALNTEQTQIPQELQESQENGGNLENNENKSSDTKISENGLEIEKLSSRNAELAPDHTEPKRLPPTTHTMQSPHNNQDNNCTQCNSWFTTRRGLTIHMAKHRTATKYFCGICREHFSSNFKLIDHKPVHKNMKFRCSDCKEAFTDHCDYLVHELTHKQRKTYRCLECTCSFKKKVSIKIHLQTHFERNVECKVCQKVISNTKYAMHLKEHDILLDCVECGKKIGSQYMKRHMLGHTQVKMHQCLYCGKCFVTNKYREIHTRTHTNERLYKCSICPQRFYTQGDRDRHVTTHSSTKEFECSFCSKKFRRKESLVTHESVHSGTQRYKCDMCDKVLSTATGIKMHKIYKHTDNKVECKTCNLFFKSSGAVRFHTRTIKHKNNVYRLKMEAEKNENKS